MDNKIQTFLKKDIPSLKAVHETLCDGHFNKAGYYKGFQRHRCRKCEFTYVEYPDHILSRGEKKSDVLKSREYYDRMRKAKVLNHSLSCDGTFSDFGTHNGRRKIRCDKCGFSYVPTANENV